MLTILAITALCASVGLVVAIAIIQDRQEGWL